MVKVIPFIDLDSNIIMKQVVSIDNYQGRRTRERKAISYNVAAIQKAERKATNHAKKEARRAKAKEATRRRKENRKVEKEQQRLQAIKDRKMQVIRTNLTNVCRAINKSVHEVEEEVMNALSVKQCACLPKLIDAPTGNTCTLSYIDRLMSIKQFATDVEMYKCKFYLTDDPKYVRRIQRCVKAIGQLD